MARYRLKHRSDFDFSRAPVYQKTAVLKKSQVKIAAKREEVVTRLNGAEETRNIARPGDYIITGPHGERYVIGAAKFKSLYQLEEGRPARYRAKGRVRALRLEEDTELVAPWGEKQRAAKGGVVVQRVGKPAEIYLIDGRVFDETYAPAK